jgi:hypothetical protein
MGVSLLQFHEPAVEAFRVQEQGRRTVLRHRLRLRYLGAQGFAILLRRCVSRSGTAMATSLKRPIIPSLLLFFNWSQASSIRPAPAEAWRAIHTWS